MAKVLFQSTNPRLLRSTFVGYLYEIAQEHQVVLLADGMDEHTKSLLQDKGLFPGLENIIFFESPFGKNVIRKNIRLHAILAKAVSRYKPDVVVAPSDLWPAEMYLLRLAKRARAVTLAMQPGFKMAEQKRLLPWAYQNSCARMPSFLPLSIKMPIAKAKKFLGYALYHWMLPLAAGEMPFVGKVSFIFWEESSGKRDADYSAVFSKRDRDLCVKDGVRPEKIFVLGHPLEHTGTRKFFEKAYSVYGKTREDSKTLTIMWPGEKVGFREQDHSLISEQDIWGRRVSIVKRIAACLGDWKIFIKPHPTEKEAAQIKESLERISPSVAVVNPVEPAEKYIEMSQCIVGISLPSTTLFTAQKQYPGKIILSLNLDNEFLGDSYKDFEGIEYIDTEERLDETIHDIGKGTYRKEGENTETFDFGSASELVNYVYAKRIS
ncbi:MAG: hypothetical protein HYT49_00355 [Candidatus Wildermuthbacteria bacterium]|nr:hypothetical protein [Candidatus Wildermuthbacteria bacterium]